MKTDALLEKYPIISDQVDRAELRVILAELEHLLQQGVRGNIVEFGCYTGTTSLFIRRLCDAYDFSGEFHVYDSFAGLPVKTSQDESALGVEFVAGELLAPKRTFIDNFKKANLALPMVHKGWFLDLTAEDTPDEIMFAFFDGDFYDSIRDSFRVCEGKYTEHATIIVDDYGNDRLPGAAKAAGEWARARGVTIQSQASLGIIRLK